MILRVWHKDTGEYRRIDRIDFKDGRADCITTRDLETGHDPFDDAIEDVVLERATGYKDRKGHMIYEGDLIRNPINDSVWWVYWEEEVLGFWIRSNSPLIGCLLSEFDWDHRSRSRGYIHENCEIVGNIHENKELWEK